jgi:hypothetical protein
MSSNIGEFAGTLLTPVSAVGFVLAAWRLGADIGWTNAFPLSDGLLSHWMVWIAIGVLIQVFAANLKRGLRRNSWDGRRRLFWLGAWPVLAQPVIADLGVTNAASYATLGATGAGIAPGSIFVIFGTGLGPDRLQAAAEYPLRTELAGTSVNIGGTSAFLLYASASSMTEGTRAVTVTFNGVTSQPVQVPITPTDFGIFTRNSAGYGQAAAQTVSAVNGIVSSLGLANAVRPGEPVVLYGTGLGAIAGTPDDACLL